MLNQSNLKKGEIALKVILFGVAIYFTLFNHLGNQAIRLWDESRVALNAYEMHHEGYSIITPFKGEPDMWNLKPPLLIWCQATCMKIFGVNELSVRLPAALGALMTCIFLMWLSIRHFKSYWFGFFAVIILVSSKGFVFEHTARTGEYDGILTFFTTFYAIFFFLFAESTDEKQRRKYYNWAWFAVTMAVFTKGIAGLLITPGIFIYLFARKQILPILKMRQTYINLGIFLAIILGYYFGREAINPGYLDEVWRLEMGGRYVDQGDPNVHFFWFLNRFFNINFVNWYPFLFLGLIVGLLWKDRLLGRLVAFCMLVATCFQLLLANSGTQLQWYDMPTYPFVSIVAAVALYWVLEALKGYELRYPKFSQQVLPYILVLGICFPAYLQLVKDVTYIPQRNDEARYDVSYYLKLAIKDKVDLKDYVFCYDDYQPYNLFYIWILQNEKNKPIEVKKSTELKIGDKPIVNEQEVKEYITTNYKVDTLESYKSMIVFELKDTIHTMTE